MSAKLWTGSVHGMTAQLPHTIRELDSRCADGIHVRLLWNEQDGHVTVAVADTKAGDEFAIEVRDGDRALDVFQHPYAYAAWRDLESVVTDGVLQPIELRAA